MQLALLGIVLALLIVILYNTIKILKEYERGVIFFLGRFQASTRPYRQTSSDLTGGCWPESGRSADRLLTGKKRLKTDVPGRLKKSN